METHIDLSALRRRGGKTDIRWDVLAAEAIADSNVPGGYAAVMSRPTANEFVDPVEHADIWWPRHVRATWTHGRLEVDMVVRTDPENGPNAIWVAFSAPEGLRSEHDRNTPWLSMAKDSARMLATGLFETPRHAPRISQEDRHARFRFVADEYQEGIEQGLAHDRSGGIRGYVYERLWEEMPELAVSEKMVSQLFWQARKTIDPQTGEPFLAPTTPGKATA